MTAKCHYQFSIIKIILRSLLRSENNFIIIIPLPRISAQIGQLHSEDLHLTALYPILVRPRIFQGTCTFQFEPLPLQKIGEEFVWKLPPSVNRGEFFALCCRLYFIRMFG